MHRRRLAVAIGFSIVTVVPWMLRKPDRATPVPMPPLWVTTAAVQPSPTIIRSDLRGVELPIARIPSRDNWRAGDGESAGARVPAQWLSPRLVTLDVKSSWRASAIGVEDQLLLRELQQVLSQLWINRVAATNDAIFFGVSEADNLARIGSLKNALNDGGVLWVFYRKSPSLSRARVTATARAEELLPTKAITFSATHDAAAFTASSILRRRGARPTPRPAGPVGRTPSKG
jgi:hypothetical protein